MKLLGNNLSPFVRKVITVLKLKQLEFDHEPTLPGDTSEAFRSVSPTGKVPALIDGELRVADSSVICEYLEEAYPEIPVMPSDPKDRARSRWLEEYADTFCAASAGTVFFERMAKPVVFGGETDEARVEQAIERDIPPVLDYLESQVPASGFVFGRFGTVDIALASFFIQAAYGGYELDTQRWPIYSAYLARVKAHPVVVEVLAAEAEVMAAILG